MWGGIDQQLYGIVEADQRLTDAVEKDLANAALFLAPDIPDGSRSVPIMR
jgi:hypothetical protein